MEKIEQYSEIKFFVKNGLKAIEIHIEIVNVLGESVPEEGRTESSSTSTHSKNTRYL